MGREKRKKVRSYREGEIQRSRCAGEADLTPGPCMDGLDGMSRSAASGQAHTYLARQAICDLGELCCPIDSTSAPMTPVYRLWRLLVQVLDVVMMAVPN